MIELKKKNCILDLYDPYAISDEIKNIYKIKPITTLKPNRYDGVIISVAHNEFKNMSFNNIVRLCKKIHVIYDLKYIFSNKGNN